MAAAWQQSFDRQMSIDARHFIARSCYYQYSLVSAQMEACKAKTVVSRLDK